MAKICGGIIKIVGPQDGGYAEGRWWLGVCQICDSSVTVSSDRPGQRHNRPPAVQRSDLPVPDVKDLKKAA